MKTRHIIMAAVAIMGMASSCSSVDVDDRLIYVKPADVGRCVLIEDFTGQRCSNCPTATEEIEKLQEQYGDTAVIAVGIHSGPLGFGGSKKYPVGLTTDEGEEYYDSHSIPSQPWGVFNRSQESGNTSNWGTIVYEEIQRTVPMTMALTNSFDADTRTANISVDMTALSDVDGKLQVWLIEDGIVAVQFMLDGSINADYVHNHVFRSSVNGTWGESISIADGASATKQYSMTLDENWVADNVSIVAFVYNDDGVQQACKAALTDNAKQ